MDQYLGQILMVAFDFAPRGWALCAGQLLSIQQNQALFSLLGTTYGGDGRTTFALPDLRGRMALHPGQGPGLPNYRQGERSGTPTTFLSVNNLPPHNHPINASSGEGTQSNPTGAFPANANVVAERGADPVGVDAYATSSNGTMASGMVGNSGGGQAFNNMPPYLALNYIIALQGIFPSRP